MEGTKMNELLTRGEDTHKKINFIWSVNPFLVLWIHMSSCLLLCHLWGYTGGRSRSCSSNNRRVYGRKIGEDH